MIEFAGRKVVASSTGSRALIAAREKTVAICDLRDRTCSTSFDTVFDAGGDRLALSDQLDGVVAAAYGVHGLTFYSCTKGTLLWQRKDLKKIQRVSLSRDGTAAYCGREGTSLVEVDLSTGKTIRTRRGVHALFDGAFEDVQLLDAARPQLLKSDGSRLYFVDRITFAFLDVTFAPGVVVVSESGGPVRCIDIASGNERWRYTPVSGAHVLRLAHASGRSCMVGVEWPYAKGGAKTLVQWSMADGAVLSRRILGQPADCCFGLEGKVIVLSDGSILPAD